LALLAAGCGAQGSDGEEGELNVLATTTVLADVAQNVAGDRFTVDALVPRNADLHAFEPTPGDLRRIAGADLLVVNGAGLEGWLDKYLEDVDEANVVTASKGLVPREPGAGEPVHEHEDAEAGEEEEAHHDEEADPHFWLDPTLVKSYVDEIAAAFAARDPGHAAAYRANAAAYKEQLDELDVWIAEQVATVPPERRKLVMNHASHGYWADRYDFQVVGAVIPSVSTGAAPTAADLSDLMRTIRREKVAAIFVEVAENPALAQQIAGDAGVRVVTDLLDHSLTGRDGVAPTYIDMMKFDTTRIVEALRQ
jgi:ABC-type Zn uptake system ZnuABC Zn-binding protein ZnuA